MSLNSTADYQNILDCFLWWMEETTGMSVGNIITTPEYTSTSPVVQISPWVYDVLRHGYNPQDTTNFGPAQGYDASDGTLVQAWPEGQSPTEAADQADITTVVTAYLTYKNARLSNDTNDVTVINNY